MINFNKISKSIYTKLITSISLIKKLTVSECDDISISFIRISYLYNARMKWNGHHHHRHR